MLFKFKSADVAALLQYLIKEKNINCNEAMPRFIQKQEKKTISELTT
jgi:hypothetical protein